MENSFQNSQMSLDENPKRDTDYLNAGDAVTAGIEAGGKVVDLFGNVIANRAAASGVQLQKEVKAACGNKPGLFGLFAKQSKKDKYADCANKYITAKNKAAATSAATQLALAKQQVEAQRMLTEKAGYDAKTATTAEAEKSARMTKLLIFGIAGVVVVGIVSVIIIKSLKPKKA